MAVDVLCKDIHIAYGTDVVAQSLALQAEAGSFLCLLGPSGCGKSTLLRALGDLQRVSGTIEIGGDSPQMAWKRLAFVFQQPRLLPWRSALDNVATGIQLRDGHWSTRGLRDRVRPRLEQVGIGDLADRRAHLLSGGESQRVAIARALSMEPDLLLMDEPFSALDVRTRLDLRQQLISLWKSTGVTIVFVTHDVDEALELATKVVVFSAKPTTILREFNLSVEHGKRRHSAIIDQHRHDIMELFGAGASDREVGR